MSSNRPATWCEISSRNNPLFYTQFWILSTDVRWYGLSSAGGTFPGHPPLITWPLRRISLICSLKIYAPPANLRYQARSLRGQTWNGQKRSEIGTHSFARANSEPVMPILWIMESNHAAKLWAEVFINWRDRNEHETSWPIRYSRGQKKARARHHRLTQHSTLNSGMSRQVEGMSESRQCVLGAFCSSSEELAHPAPGQHVLGLRGTGQKECWEWQNKGGGYEK